MSKGNEAAAEKSLEEVLVVVMVAEFKKTFPKYPTEQGKDFSACLEISKD
jgi:hypothetical protein